MSKNLVVWTDIPVRDLHRAAAYYSKVLGAEVTLQKFADFEFGLLPQSDPEGTSGCLLPVEEAEPSRNGALVYLSVEGRLDEAEKLAAEGGEIWKSKHQIGPHGFRTVIIDSEGNRIALHSMSE